MRAVDTMRKSKPEYLCKVIAAEVTSNIRQIASEVPLGEQEGLPSACVANCDNIRVVPRLSLTKRAGELTPERWVDVKRVVGALSKITTTAREKDDLWALR